MKNFRQQWLELTSDCRVFIIGMAFILSFFVGFSLIKFLGI